MGGAYWSYRHHFYTWYEVITSINQFLSGDPDEETLMQEKIAAMDAKLDQILKDLDEIKGKISQLTAVVQAEVA